MPRVMRGAAGSDRRERRLGQCAVLEQRDLEAKYLGGFFGRLVDKLAQFAQRTCQRGAQCTGLDFDVAGRHPHAGAGHERNEGAHCDAGRSGAACVVLFHHASGCCDDASLSTTNPASTSARIAARAADASGPLARKCSVAPLAALNRMTLTGLLASTHGPAVSSANSML